MQYVNQHGFLEIIIRKKVFERAGDLQHKEDGGDTISGVVNVLITEHYLFLE